jgi:hypothetical protein
MDGITHEHVGMLLLTSLRCRGEKQNGRNSEEGALAQSGFRKRKTIKDIGHEDVVEWPSERHEEIEWTMTTRPSKAIERE